MPIGAILGAPFMLATLAMFVVGASALFFRRRRVQGTRLRIDAATIGRDVGFFLVFFAVPVAFGSFSRHGTSSRLTSSPWCSPWLREG